MTKIEWADASWWLGITAENQKAADERIPILLQIPAAVRFVILEPLLSPVDLKLVDDYDPIGGLRTNADMLDWVIAGCESGPKRRPAKLKWLRDIRDQCQEAGVPLFIKQIEVSGKVSHNMNEWPEDLRIRQFPEKTN